MSGQSKVQTESSDLLSSRTRFSLEWVRQGNQVGPVILFDGHSVGLLKDLHVGVDGETGIPLLTLTVYAPGLSIAQRDLSAADPSS